MFSMPDWEEDSPILRRNLASLIRRVRNEALARRVLSLESARGWHREFLRGLAVPRPAMVGTFRGEPGLVGVEMRIGPHFGVSSGDVVRALAAFERRMQEATKRLDALIPPGGDLSEDQLAAVIDLCAWAHSEWVRIHPFANGNGRIARLWANSLAMRYGLPPYAKLRPRPDGGYASAGEASMRGDWQPTAALFRDMLSSALRDP